MPVFGQKVDVIDGSTLYVQLKNVGEQVRFRLVKTEESYTFDAKHFLQNAEGKWDSWECPRVMHEQPCETCDKWFDIRKEMKEVVKDSPEYKELDKESGKYKAKLTFFYPIIDRGIKKAKILQTTLSVRKDLESDFANGLDVYDYDYILKRNAKNGADTYILTRMDSKMSLPFDIEEQLQYDMASAWDLIEKIGGRKSKQEYAHVEEPEANVALETAPDVVPSASEPVMDQKVNVDDVPF